MILYPNSDIFNILRLDIIILWDKMGSLRRLYSSTLSNPCILIPKHYDKIIVRVSFLFREENLSVTSHLWFKTSWSTWSVRSIPLCLGVMDS